MTCLALTVRFYDGRYHGQLDWPPSPARLFQALVAGAAHGKAVEEEDRHALRWLEALEAPIIAAPTMRLGQRLRSYVPNNDLDAVGGDPRRISEIRSPKVIRPILFDVKTPLIYFWTFDYSDEAQGNAQRTCAIAERVYQLGRGVDMAWAWGEIIEDIELESRLDAHGGPIYRPSKKAGGIALGAPHNGSLQALVTRHNEMSERFRTFYKPKPNKRGPDHKEVGGLIFSQPLKPRFRQVAYDSPPVRLLFDLIGERTPWRLDCIVALSELVRNAAAQKLKEKLPSESGKIENSIIGRPDSDEADKASRVRLMPLPSIGHRHADHAIRRVLVEVPANCQLRADDVEWAMSGLQVIDSMIDPETGEVRDQLALVSAVELDMLGHYGVDTISSPRLWRTVTPAALPQQAARRRIDPASRSGEEKGGRERTNEEKRAVFAATQALRHAAVSTRPLTMRVQREPFEAKGRRAEAFAPRTRFPKERLWHIEIAFAQPVRGPLIIGDGRYLGLGLLRPVKEPRRDVMVFPLLANERVAVSDCPHLLRAVRRALMALARTRDGAVETLFSGHEPEGAKANSGRHRHVFLASADINRDGYLDDLIVSAPWACDRSTRPGRREPADFDRVAASLGTVRAGRLGVIKLGPPEPPQQDDALFGPSREWESETLYRPTRHARRSENLTDAIVRDVIAECERRNLPRPEVEILESAAGPNGGGLEARLRLRFAVAVDGPILLGRDSHAGGGLFMVVPR
jgi:CRISPR-associated protein Csb2